MDRRFGKIYREMLDEYTRRVVIFQERDPLEREMVRAIRDEVAVSGLRADGKLFLVLNMHMMVVAPILAARHNNIGPERLREDVLHDLRRIIEDATRQPEFTGPVPYEPDAPSAHAVMASVDRLWRELRINKWRVWGEDDE